MSDYITKICEFCNEPYECVNRKRVNIQRFCSMACSNRAKNEKRLRRVTSTCELCEQSFEARAWNAKTRQYCSVVCRNKANAQKQRLTRNTCKNCGIEFYRDNTSQLFCSDKCSCEHQSAIEKQQATVKYICEQYPTADLGNLQDELGISVSNIRSIAYKHGILRSQEAMLKMYEGNSEWMTKNNPMYRSEVAAKVSDYWKANPEKKREIAIKGIRANQVSKPSKPELRCAEYLTTLGIEFEHQAMIKDKFIADFRIGNIILECDGEYWHGHPRFEPLTQQQIKQQKRDNARDKYLQTCGYTVIRIWENDITIDNLRNIFLRE